MTSDLGIDAAPASPPQRIAHAASSAVPIVPPVDATAAQWRRRYARRLWVSDLLVLVWVVYGTQIARYGFGNVDVYVRDSGQIDDFSYWLFSAVLTIAWMWMLSLIDSRSERVIGTGSAEYVRIVQASLRIFGAIAILAFLLRVDVARGYLLVSLPAGVLVLVIERWIWRQWLISKRALGQYSARVLLVGSGASVAHLAHELARSPRAGYRVVGACVPAGPSTGYIAGTDIPIVGDVHTVERSVVLTAADTVAVTSTDELPPDKVKEISWSLQPGRQHLVLAPSIIDIAGPRIHTRPVSGLPLIHVETPRFSRGQRFSKRAFDLAVSTTLIGLLAPVLIVLAIIVRNTSPGPAFYRQERVGQDGQPFYMLKFRTMRTGADTELAALLAAQGTSETPLFKVHDDPRITPIGRVLRKYSLDELPQLFNVFGGSMSIVGPRPQIAAEVALYTDAARRRLLARPGITGLWQVSGRSSLNWAETVRLDLYYVENWSLVSDIVILVRTVRAVIRPGESAH